uniref:Reverse transcriptase domain-containing protein n=1 Tax=Tanacetum cinerariifolium TaxID=118510 RepID=A0A699JH19_TANCI|nr:hypothetical protein [Tanacetum cinerariifolium]
MNQNFYNSNSSGFDQIQPPQYSVIHHPPQKMSEEILQARENLMKSIQTFFKKFNRISFRETPKVLTRAWDNFFKIQHAQPEDIHELLEDLKIINEKLAEYINSLSWNRPAFFDDDDEYSIKYKEYLENSSNAISPVLPTEEPDNSLSIEDEHLSTILKTESDEVIKSSVEDLVPIPSESESILDDMCDVPFSDKNHFDAESDLIEYLLTRDTTIVYSPKIDSLLEEFTGELVHIDPIPPGIDETNSNPKDDIRFIDLEEVKDEIVRAKLLNIYLLIAKIESLNNNPTPDFMLNVVMNNISDNSTNDPLMEVVDLFLASDNSIPLGIENVDYDSEGDILFLKELLRNDSLLLPEFESFHFDLYDDPSSPRPPEKPPDDGGILTTKVVDDISDNSTRELYVHVLNVLTSLPTLYLSHRGFKVFQLVNNFKSPVMIYGENIPHLDVPFLHFYPP